MHSLKFAAIGPGDTVAVFGAGPIGLLTIASLKVAGAGRIWAVEPVAHRREMAKQMGADEALDPNQGDAASRLSPTPAGAGSTAPSIARPKEHTHNWALRVVRNGGRMVLTGIHSAALVPFEVSHMRRKEIAIFNVRRSNHEDHDALRLLTEKLSWFAPLVTHRRPLADIAGAFRAVEGYEDGVGKMVIV